MPRCSPLVRPGKASGGLRIGWIRASARTIASLIQARDSLDLGTPLLEQLACSWLLENAATLLPPRRNMLKARRDMCETLMAEYFPRWRFSPPEGGLSFGWNFLTCWPPCSLRVRKARIHIGTGTRFGLEGAFDRYLRLPFTLPDEALRRAFSTLQPLWQSLAEQKENTRLRKII